MLQSNNAALLAGNLDISGLSEGFRDGQKLRQEYESRQQQKALNEIMKIGDHNGRLEAAQQHKYAGALVPLLQKYDEDRQKAALDNLKAGADIGKIYGETGEIGAKTQSQNLKNIGEGNTILANSAAGLDRTAANLTIGQLYNAGFYTAPQAEMLLQKANSGKPEDIEFLKSIARTNPELAKLFQPEAKVLDGKDAAYMYTVDGFTGEANEPTQRVAYGQSPDNILDNETSRLNNQNTVEGQRYASNNSYNASVYGTDSRAQTASEAQAIDWYKAQTGANVAQQNADTNRLKTQSGTVSANGQPVRKLNTTEQKKLFEIQDQQNADKSVIQTLDKMMKLVDNSYSGVAATGRARGMSNIGLGGERADNTVLYDNLATSQALAQLKATFGAAPTEGERKILMDIQASASKTPMQKKQIIAQAFRAVQARQKYREELANGIRTGRYMVPTTSPQATQPKATSQNSKGASIIGGILGGG
ncbi:hypothetical protein ACTXMK_05385 [Psychrobacter celer]|uniref:hypothetical protein n=1 Tax=Psychrobacter celer TaxID=306572 RepID=UPI003FCF035A